MLRRGLLDHDPRSSDVVRLAAVERDLRAQQFDGPRSFTHFCLLGLVSAGRDCGEFPVRDGGDAGAPSIAHSRRAQRGRRQRQHPHHRFLWAAPSRDRLPPRATACRASDSRLLGRTNGRTRVLLRICFKLAATWEGAEIELGDGGLVDWTQLLLQSRKERLMISGLSVERLALVGRDNPSRKSGAASSTEWQGRPARGMTRSRACCTIASGCPFWSAVRGPVTRPAGRSASIKRRAPSRGIGGRHHLVTSHLQAPISACGHREHSSRPIPGLVSLPRRNAIVNHRGFVGDS